LGILSICGIQIVGFRVGFWVFQIGENGLIDKFGSVFFRAGFLKDYISW
jgi:hypothetical protein